MKKLLHLIVLFSLYGCHSELSAYTEKEKRFIREIKQSVVYKALSKAQIPVVFMICNNVKNLDDLTLGIHKSKGKHHAIFMCMGRARGIDEYLETLQHEAMHVIQFCTTASEKGNTFFLHDDNVADAKNWGRFDDVDKDAKNKYKPKAYKSEFEAYLYEKKEFTENFPIWISEACDKPKHKEIREYFWGKEW